MSGIKRHKTRVVKIGGVGIGGANPVAVQSMAKFKTSDKQNCLRQIRALEKAGCDIVRLAIKDDADCLALKDIKKASALPIVADIHFDWRLAIKAIENGADKIRLNPGNIFKKEEVSNVARAALQARIPIRVGANSGSLREKRTCQAASLVKSVSDYIKLLEKNKFHDIVISLKASNIFDTVEAYRRMSKICDHPLHLGVTATGTPYAGTIKSSIALGMLLAEGIGDTIRVSLTDKPEREVTAARAILSSLGLADAGPQIISCPTCGRCEVNLIKIVKDLESRLEGLTGSLPVKIAVMGCVVNGPGEAREADIGIAFGKKEGLLFKKGKPAGKVGMRDCLDVLLKEAADV